MGFNVELRLDAPDGLKLGEALIGKNAKPGFDNRAVINIKAPDNKPHRLFVVVSKADPLETRFVGMMNFRVSP
jgi:hypothetical protein